MSEIQGNQQVHAFSLGRTWPWSASAMESTMVAEGGWARPNISVTLEVQVPYAKEKTKSAGEDESFSTLILPSPQSQLNAHHSTGISSLRSSDKERRGSAGKGEAAASFPIISPSLFSKLSVLGLVLWILSSRLNCFRIQFLKAKVEGNINFCLISIKIGFSFSVKIRINSKLLT